MDILSAAKHHHMFDKGDKVLVAVSGGPDSIALLHSLHTRSEEFGISLHVAHLNHGIRGEASDLDEQFVKEFAYKLGLNCTTKRVDIPSIKTQMQTCLEDVARVVRYKFLQDTAAMLDADKIAVGHNADDRAESVLFNIIRGAGIDGISSIKPIRGNIVRPLLHTTRREIEEYIKEHTLPFRVDETNMDTVYSRNRIRHELLPLLESGYNSQIRSALVRLADIASDTNDFIARSADNIKVGLVYRDAWDVDLFAELPVAIQRQILRSEIESLKGDLKDVSLEQIDRVLDALRTKEDFKITLPTGRIYAVRQAERFGIELEQAGETIESFDRQLCVPGITHIPEIASTIKAEIVETPIISKLPGDEAIIDCVSIKGALRVRSIRPGDRITPLGMAESKKLQDVFVDKKIPRQQRAKTAIVVDDEKILWVAGVVSSDIGKISHHTRRAIHLQIGPA
ncbi:MAG: tRNA lysidine(34) synthetase TilS [Armatimonadota bacterium]